MAAPNALDATRIGDRSLVNDDRLRPSVGRLVPSRSEGRAIHPIRSSHRSLSVPHTTGALGQRSLLKPRKRPSVGRAAGPQPQRSPRDPPSSDPAIEVSLPTTPERWDNAFYLRPATKRSHFSFQSFLSLRTNKAPSLIAGVLRMVSLSSTVWTISPSLAVVSTTWKSPRSLAM